MTNHPQRRPRPHRAGGTGRRVAASLAVVAAAATVTALPALGPFTDERAHFTDSVLAP